jgi:hypothetical protein
MSHIKSSWNQAKAEVFIGAMSVAAFSVGTTVDICCWLNGTLNLNHVTIAMTSFASGVAALKSYCNLRRPYLPPSEP